MDKPLLRLVAEALAAQVLRQAGKKDALFSKASPHHGDHKALANVKNKKPAV
jgi:hypothetical protein